MTGRRASASAVVTTVIAVLPSFLFGALAVQIAAELHFSPASQGLTVAAHFGFSALCSVPVGILVEKYGPTVTSRAGIALAGLLELTIAGFARSFTALIVLIMLTGLANALGQLGSNLSLARHVPARRRGLSFGIKQAAIPLSTLVAGLAVPVLGLTLGWRWAFGIAGVVSLLAIGVVPRDPRPTTSPRPPRPQTHDRPTGPLAVIGAAAALGAAGGTAMGSFLVAWAVHSGIGAGPAGLILAFGSVVGVAARVGHGWLADRRTGGHLRMVAIMLAVGAVGMVTMSWPATGALLLGSGLGFAFGWAWPGVLNYAVTEVYPKAPAAATSVTQTGVYLGGFIGPMTFGVIVGARSYQTAWLAAAAALSLGAVLMMVGRRILRNRQRRQGDTQPVLVST